MRYRYVLEFETKEEIPADVLADLQGQFDVQIESLGDADLQTMEEQDMGSIEYTDVKSTITKVEE